MKFSKGLKMNEDNLKHANLPVPKEDIVKMIQDLKEEGICDEKEIMGSIMKLTKGQETPKRIQEIVREHI